MKKLTASLVSLVTVGSFSRLNQVLAKDPSEVSTSLENFSYSLTENKDTLKLNDSFEKQKSKSEQKMDFIYLNEETDEKGTNTNKKESIESKTEEAKEGIFSKISSKIAKAFSSVVGYCRSRINKSIRMMDDVNPLVKSATQNLQKALEIFKDLKTENYNITFFEKTGQNKQDLIAFAIRFNEESKKPGNDILQCFFNALLSEEFKSFPILKVTNQEGKIVGYIRLAQRFTTVEFIPFFLNKSEAKQALTEVILSFKKQSKEVKADKEKDLKEVWERLKKSGPFGFLYGNKAFENYLKYLKDEVILVPFGGESKSSQDTTLF